MSATTTYKNLQDRILDLLGKSDATTRSRVKNWINLGQYDFIMREQWPFRTDTTAAPDELSDDDDETSIPIEYREALVHYGLSLEHDYNTDPDLAQKAMNRYEQIVILARNNLLAQDMSDYEMEGPLSTVNWTDANDISNTTVEA
jgi:hypothetical protein